MKKIVIMCLCVWSNSITAGVITSASSVLSSPSPINSFTANNTIDQSGLSIGYTSGITDFDTYISGAPTHSRNNLPANYFASLSIGNIDFDMGSSLSLSKIAFWNYPFTNSAGIESFDVFTSSSSNFVVANLAGSFLALDDANTNSVQVFDLIDSTAQFIRISVNSTFGGTALGFSEIAFDVNTTSQVPEPTSLALLGLGLAGFGFSRKKKKA